MKDSELRAIVLTNFYEKRRLGLLKAKPEDFNPPLLNDDLMSICDQLGEIGLLNWKPIRYMGKSVTGHGQITAAGIDVVEDQGRNAPVEFVFPMSQQFTFNSPANVQVGDHNSQSIIQTFSNIIEKIDSSSASVEEKAAAKSHLRAFLEHPLVTSVIGSVAGSLVGMLK